MRNAEPQSGSSRSRWGIAALVALLALAPIVVGIIITSGSVPRRAANGLAFTAVKVPPSKPATRHPTNGNLPPGTGALVALIRHPTTIKRSPGGPTLAPVSTRTGFGSPQVMLVTQVRGAWLGVLSPLVGNNRTGWILRSATNLGRVPWELKVSLARRSLAILYAGKVIRHYSVAIGAPGAPTPTGRFAVTDRLFTGDPSGPYGCCILALSAKSPHAIQGWSGGNRIAIHSTPDSWTVGKPVSHGCLRVTLPDGHWLLDHIPLGTPTLIST